MWIGQRRLKYIVLKDHRCTFIFGCLLGASLALALHIVKSNPPFVSAIWPEKINQEFLSYDNAPYDFAYEKWLQAFAGTSCPVDPDILRYTNETRFPGSQKCPGELQVPEIGDFIRDVSKFDPRSEASFLKDKVNVACLILSTDVIKATAIRDTWGGNCNSLSLVSHKKLEIDSELKKNSTSSLITNPAKVELVKAASEFGLLCRSLRILWSQKRDEIQWVLVTPEDAFALPENLRFFVAAKNESDSHYLGHAMRFWNIIYNWGDAGYVLSKGTLQKLMEEFPTDGACDKGGQYWKNSDWYLGKHLAMLGIHPVDTRDHIGRGRFIGHSLKKLLFPGGVSLFERYWKDSLYLSPDGPHCCSNYAITFRLSTSTTRIFQFQYLYYHLRPFYGGGHHGNQLAPQNLKSPDNHAALTVNEKLKEEALDKIFFNALRQNKL